MARGSKYGYCPWISQRFLNSATILSSSENGRFYTRGRIIRPDG